MARTIGAVKSPATAVVFDLALHEGIAEAVTTIKPAAIIHAAAVNPGDGDALMEAVNHKASAALAAIAADANIRFVMVSTESVHSGRAAPYRDDSVPDPINEYGRSKAAGESAVQMCNPDAVIVRTSLIYSLEKMDRGTRGFRDRLLRGEQLQLFDDVLRQPVSADSLSIALCELAVRQTDVTGTLNFVGAETMSRAEFGLAMMDYWGIDAGTAVSFCSGAQVAGVQKDLTCLCERADALGFARPGVSDVLRNSRKR